MLKIRSLLGIGSPREPKTKYARVADTELVPQQIESVCALVRHSTIWQLHGTLTVTPCCWCQCVADLCCFWCVQLSVKGMTCSACTSAVESALK
jgi:hypothetical protein